MFREKGREREFCFSFYVFVLKIFLLIYLCYFCLLKKNPKAKLMYAARIPDQDHPWM